MPFIMQIIGAVLCTIASFWYPGSPAGPWYGRVHLGWLGVSFWMWAIILGPHLR